jgi:AraC family transcriptional regulator
MIREDTRDGYIQSVNRALDYINAHYADELTLDILAREASFSPYHFHRVFKGIVGETHQEYVNRIRLEKAILRMDEGATLTDIALAVGFSSQAHFTQSFRARYRVSPKNYREGRRNARRTKLAQPKIDDAGRRADLPKDAVRTRVYPDCSIAYVRHIGNYDFRIGFAWGTLMAWARKRNLLDADSLRISLSWDEPGLTPDGRLRYDACVTVPDGTAGEGPISVKTLEGGAFAVFPYEGRVDGLADFYDEVYGLLLPGSGVRLRDLPGYRVHRESAADQIIGNYRHELRIPIEL